MKQTSFEKWWGKKMSSIVGDDWDEHPIASLWLEDAQGLAHKAYLKGRRDGINSTKDRGYETPCPEWMLDGG